jgi:hypothetical protein
MKDEKKNSSEQEKSVAESSNLCKSKNKLDKQKLIYLFSTVGLSAFFCAFYYCSMELSSRNPKLYYFFPAVMFGYMAALTVLVLTYIIYNRGFSRKGVTVDMLPAEWSEDKKIEFIENGKFRLQRSKWLLVFIIALLFTFVVEAFLLFALPVIKELF